MRKFVLNVTIAVLAVGAISTSAASAKTVIIKHGHPHHDHKTVIVKH